ncbi:MAG: carbohydrate ABC transporter permease [Microbacterium sp.]|uniref:carbohydrate ABC transporter permease n=1 Tax=Microbacterium sp. TaxID=51671 RepID=UPI0039E21882
MSGLSESALVAAPLPARRPRRRPSVGRIVGWAFMLVVIVATLFPFYWMLRTALSNTQALAADPTSLLPVGFTWDAFARVLGLASTSDALAQGGSGASMNFWLYLGNSVVVSTTITVCQVFFCALGAYAFARLNWRGRDQVFFVLLTALMIPPIFTILPNYLTIKSLGLTQTLAGIILPSAFMTPFALFFLRQFFLSVNREIEEAATLDGLGRIAIFFRIILPMSWAPVTTLAVLTYITSWNDYMWPLLVASKDQVRVLTVALGVFKAQTPTGTPDWAGLMAATVVSTIPLLVLYAVLGKRIVNSIGFTGLK